MQNTTPEEKVQIKQSILFHSLFPEFSDNITKLFADENYLEQFKVVCSSSQDFAKLLKEAILPCYIKAKINAMVDEVKSSQTDIAEIMDGHSVAESLDSSLDIGEMSSIEKTGLGSDYFSD
ncbi:MAG: hypothetical protein K0R02_1134 [Rickettsiaceae bacterium]|nr:hypothetical protein [Rickettsiaceae bacterium]